MIGGKGFGRLARFVCQAFSVERAISRVSQPRTLHYVRRTRKKNTIFSLVHTSTGATTKKSFQTHGVCGLLPVGVLLGLHGHVGVNLVRRVRPHRGAPHRPYAGRAPRHLLQAPRDGGGGGLVRQEEEEGAGGVAQQGQDGGEDGDGDEERADGVGHEEGVALDEDGGGDDAHAAQGVGQDVQEDALHVGVVAVAVVVGPAPSVGVPVPAAAEGGDADEVDDEPGDGDGEEALGGHPRGVEQSAEGGGEHVQGDHSKEEAVHDAGQNFQSIVT